MTFSKKFLTVFIIVIITGAVVYFGFIKRGSNPSSEDSAQENVEVGKKASESRISVKVAEVIRGDLVMKLKSPGEAVTNKRVEMKSETSGKIKNIRVKESQHVKKGELLLEIEDSEYRLDLENYEAVRLQKLSEMLLEKRFGSSEAVTEADRQSIDLAQKEYEKASALFKKGLISQNDFEMASQQMELVLIESGGKKDEIMSAAKGLTQAEINVKKSRLTLEKTKVRAPFSGIITDVKISPQENVSSGTELFTLVNIDQIQVHAKVLESEIGKMKVGREADLKFSAYPGKVMQGKIMAISPVINPEDKTCKVFITVKNPDEIIKPGMHAEVEIAAEIFKDRLLVPQDAVLIRDNRKLIFAIEDGIAKWKYIDIGLENEDYAEVLNTDKEPVVITMRYAKARYRAAFTFFAHSFDIFELSYCLYFFSFEIYFNNTLFLSFICRARIVSVYIVI